MAHIMIVYDFPYDYANILPILLMMRTEYSSIVRSQLLIKMSDLVAGCRLTTITTTTTTFRSTQRYLYYASIDYLLSVVVFKKVVQGN